MYLLIYIISHDLSLSFWWLTISVSVAQTDQLDRCSLLDTFMILRWVQIEIVVLPSFTFWTKNSVYLSPTSCICVFSWRSFVTCWRSMVSMIQMCWLLMQVSSTQPCFPQSFVFLRSSAKTIFSFIKASAALALSDIPWDGPIGEDNTSDFCLFTYSFIDLNPGFHPSVLFKFLGYNCTIFFLNVATCSCFFRCCACGFSRWRVADQPY